MVNTKKAIKGTVNTKTAVTAKKRVITEEQKKAMIEQIETKKVVAILGTADTMKYTPWQDKSIDIFAVGSCVMHPEVKRLDRILEIHHQFLWEKEKDGKVTNKYNHWDCPIYMNDDCYTDSFPKAVVYPLKEIIEHFKIMELYGIPGRELLKKYFSENVNLREKVYFTNSIAYMVALVVYEKQALGKPWEQIEFYGVHMAGGEEYAFEKSCVEYWLAWAHAAGIRTVIPEDSDLMKSGYLYGYEEEGYYTKDIAIRKKNVDEAYIKQQAKAREESEKARILEGCKNVWDYQNTRNDRRRM